MSEPKWTEREIREAFDDSPPDIWVWKDRILRILKSTTQSDSITGARIPTRKCNDCEGAGNGANEGICVGCVGVLGHPNFRPKLDLPKRMIEAQERKNPNPPRFGNSELKSHSEFLEGMKISSDGGETDIEDVTMVRQPISKSEQLGNPQELPTPWTREEINQFDDPHLVSLAGDLNKLILHLRAET